MKKFLSLIVAVALLLSAASFAAAEEKTSLTLAHCQGEWMHPMMQVVFDDYEQRTGTKIEPIYVSSEQISTWITAQFSAGTEPDMIIYSGLGAQDLYANGKLVGLTPYLAEKSAWSGNLWQDDFIDGILDQCLSTDGTVVVKAPLSTGGTRLYYNTDILEELGMDVQVDNAWSVLMENLTEVNENSDYIPMSVMNSIEWNMWWMWGYMLEDLYHGKADELLEKLDIITVNGQLDLGEILLGIKTEVISYTDPELVEMFRLLKQLVPNLNEDFNTVSWEYEGYFNAGNVAFNVNGTWYPGQYMENGLTFGYGISAIPYVDKEASEFGREVKPVYAAALGESLAISTKCETDGKLDAALNFAQYLSDAKTGALVWFNSVQLPPAVKNIQLSGAMQGLAINLPEGQEYAKELKLNTMLKFSGEAYGRFLTLFAEYLVSEQTPEDFCAKIEEIYMPFVDDEIKIREDLNIESYYDQVG